MPRVKNFLHNEAPKYQALEVEWQGGHAPELHLYNKHKKVVKVIDMGPYGEEQLHELLQQYGITTTTPKPEYLPPSFEATANCAAWRQTNNCDPNGEREVMADESCHTEIDHGRSGFCECVGRPNVEFVCEHLAFTCEEQCKESSFESDAPEESESEDRDEF